MLLAKTLGNERGGQFAALYMAAYLVTQLEMDLLKNFFNRRRPVAYIDSLSLVKRVLFQLPRMYGSNRTCYSSFPSGDVAGAASFSTVLYLLDGEGRMFMFVFVAASALGRLYFHAHHFVDVLVGGLLGAFTSAMFVSVWPGGLSWLQFLSLHVVVVASFIAFHAFLKKSKRSSSKVMKQH